MITPGSVGSATAIPLLTYNQYGQLIAASDTPAALDAAQTVSGVFAFDRLSTGGDGSGTHVPTDSGAAAKLFDVSQILNQYQLIVARGSTYGTPATTQHVVVQGGTTVATTGATAAGASFPLNPAEIIVPTGYTLKLNIRGALLTNTIAPTVSFTAALLPVATLTGAAAGTVSITVGAAVTGSSMVATTPAASSFTDLASGDFTPPAAGEYVFGIVASGAGAANSAAVVILALRYRLV